jgi:hypothetical protein
MNPEFDSIGKAFVQAYYEKFGSDRTQLVAFYQEDSLLTYEGSQTQGLEGISELYKVQRRTESNAAAMLKVER